MSKICHLKRDLENNFIYELQNISIEWGSFQYFSDKILDRFLNQSFHYVAMKINADYEDIEEIPESLDELVVLRTAIVLFNKVENDINNENRFIKHLFVDNELKNEFKDFLGNLINDYENIFEESCSNLVIHCEKNQINIR